MLFTKDDLKAYKMHSDNVKKTTGLDDADIYVFSVEQLNKFVENHIKKTHLDIPDIRNKLSPVTHLIGMVELIKENGMDWVIKALPHAKKSVNYLSQRDVYGNLKNVSKDEYGNSH